MTLAALAVVGLVACGGDDGGADESVATTAPAGSDATAAATTEPDVTDAPAPTGGPEETTAPSAPADDAGCTADRVGGELTMGVYSETAGLDPTVSTGGAVTGATELTALYDTLMQYDEDAGTWVPRLAESMEPNDDATVWTLTLREGITFGNGDPLDAAAVKASVERHQAETNRIRSRGLTADISAIDVVDDLTAVFTLARPWGSFPYLLSGEVGMIVNPAVVESLGADEFSRLPVGGGAGPYEPVSNVPGEELVLEAKEDYWGGPVCIERLRFVVVPGAQATYDAFQNDELDAAFLRGPQVIADARADGVSQHTELLNAGAVVLINNGAGGTTSPMTDVRLRRAVAAAVDPEQINIRAYDGAGLATAALAHPDSRFYEGAAGPALDPALAAQLVEEVKAEGTWDGTVSLACDSTWSNEALAIESQLEAVGFEVDADTTSSVATRIQRVIVDHDYDLACWGMSLVEASPWAALARHVDSTPGTSRTGYDNPEMNESLAVLKAARTTEEQLAAFAAIQVIWDETVPVVVFAATEEMVIWDDDVHGLDFNQETVTIFADAYLGD